VRLVGTLAPQAELGAIMPGGGLLQAMLAGWSEGEPPWGAGGLLVPDGRWSRPPDQGDADRGSRTTTSVGDDRLAA
jgi:hypothetical protein